MVRQLLESTPNDHKRPLHIVISVTTDTGFDRAQQVFSAAPFAGRVTVVRFPLDLSAYVRRFLDRLRPDVAVLMELEVWPNFVAECNRRGVPVVLINGRLTEKSYRGYRRIRPLIRPMYAGLAEVCAQEQAYARRFIDLGVPSDRVSVTGTMKFDSAQVGERVEGDEELADELGLRPRALGGSEPILVCGSTGPGEEAMLLDLYTRLTATHANLRLAIIPRKPERFDEVAQLMHARGNVVRRSDPLSLRERVASGEPQASRMPGEGPPIEKKAQPLILGDTMGELRKFYSLADIVIVGRTLLDLGEKQHGSDMIEPAALGKPVVVGPFTGNFAEPMRALLAANAIRQVTTSDQLLQVLDAWLRDPAAAADVGRRAREVVLANRGATARHVQVIASHLSRRS
jgi:3-deoxy-D-manno-octulosonic-acid transferase